MCSKFFLFVLSVYLHMKWEYFILEGRFFLPSQQGTVMQHAVKKEKRQCCVYLPGQRSSKKVEEDITQRLNVISSRLLDPEMSVDAGVPCGSSQILVLAIWDVDVSLWIAILLR